MYVVQAVSSQILFENRTLPRHSKNTSIKYESLQVRLMLAIPKIYIMQATVEKNKSYSGTTGFNFLLVDKSDHYGERLIPRPLQEYLVPSFSSCPFFLHE